MPNGISLQLINKSDNANGLTVLIFQRNATLGHDETVVAWRVVRDLPQDGRDSFFFSDDLSVSASDSWGNFTPQFPVRPGQAYQMVLSVSGDVLQLYSPGASNPSEIDVRNGLSDGAINAQLYRSKELLATKTAIAPGQKASFAFQPTLFFGVVAQMEPGEIIPPSTLPELTEISLRGVQSADIVITGGAGAPYMFTLQNVVQA